MIKLLDGKRIINDKTGFLNCKEGILEKSRGMDIYQHLFSIEYLNPFFVVSRLIAVAMVCWLVGLFVGLLVGWLVGWLVVGGGGVVVVVVGSCWFLLVSVVIVGYCWL